MDSYEKIKAKIHTNKEIAQVLLRSWTSASEAEKEISPLNEFQNHPSELFG